MKISSFVIGLVLVGMFAVVMTMYLTDGATTYNETVNTTALGNLDKTASVRNMTDSIYGELENIGTTSSVVDIIGGFLKSGYTVIKVTFASFGLFTSAANSAFSAVPQLSLFYTYIFVIAFIAFVFIVISILVGRDT
jgi:hypothetical protein